MTDLVIDASIAIKWVVDEPGSAAALALRSHRLSAPELLVAECANILWKKVRRNELSEAEALLSARALERADIQLEPMAGLLERATHLAIAIGHPAYDCMYLALAERLACDMITADRRLGRVPLPRGFNRQVLNLENSQ